LIVVMGVLSADAQNTWRSDRHGFILGGGCNFFFGDLGGGHEGGNGFFSFRDANVNYMNLSSMFGYSYRLSGRLSLRANVLFSNVAADDANSKDEARRARNLNFRSRLLDIGATMDYYFIRENTGRFDPSSFRSRFSGYFFVGFGVVHFNPMGKYGNQWYELQPLCTEGQGTGKRFLAQTNSGEKVVQAGDPYKLNAVAIPIGVGFKIQLAKDLSLGLEFAQRFTTTDYIDDCSTYYFDYAAEGVTPPSDMTMAFADRSVAGTASHKTGSKRGSSDYNDSYFTMMLTLHYRLFKGANGDK